MLSGCSLGPVCRKPAAWCVSVQLKTPCMWLSGLPVSYVGPHLLGPAVKRLWCNTQ